MLYPTCTCSSCAINCIAVLSDKGVFGGGGGVSFTRQSEVFSEYCSRGSVWKGVVCGRG